MNLDKKESYEIKLTQFEAERIFEDLNLLYDKHQINQTSKEFIDLVRSNRTSN